MADRPRHDGRLAGGHEDAELGARLGRALREAHADEHVDVARLVRETRRATATRRTKLRRFTVLAATGVAAASIPLGLELAQWSAPSAAPPAGSTPAPDRTPATSTP